MCFCSSLSEDALNFGDILDLRGSSHLPSFIIRVPTVWRTQNSIVHNILGQCLGKSPFSPPFLWQAEPHLRVCVYCFVGVTEDCGKSIDVRGGRPVFKFWLCNLPTVWLWACGLTCSSPTFGICKTGILMFTSRGYEITYMRQCVQSMHLDKMMEWWSY